MSNVSNPAGYALAVTPSDVTVFSEPTRGLLIAAAGDLSVRMYRGQNTITFTNVQAGVLPIQVDQVRFTGTTATGITRLW